MSAEAGSNPLGHSGLVFSEQKPRLGFVLCDESPRGKTFQDLKRVLHNKDGVLFFDDEIFYADKENNTITSLGNREDFAPLKEKFSKTPNEYVPADKSDYILFHALTNITIKESRMRVTDAYGFYSQPSTTKNPFLRWIKRLLSINIDLQHTHGVFKHEEIRDLDVNGLYGVSFSLSKQQYLALKNTCEQKVTTQKAAIEALKEHYPTGAERAKQHHPALSPFHIRMALTRHGITTTGSSTCKTYALELLEKEGLLTIEQKQQFLGNNAQFAFPRFGKQPLAPMRLVSIGEVIPYQTRRKKILYNREWGGNDTKLYWATPPFMINASNAAKNAITSLYRRIIKPLTRIRRAEMALHRVATEIAAPIRPEMNQNHLYKRLIIGHKTTKRPAIKTAPLKIKPQNQWRPALTMRNFFPFFYPASPTSTRPITPTDSPAGPRP